MGWMIAVRKNDAELQPRIVPCLAKVYNCMFTCEHGNTIEVLPLPRQCNSEQAMTTAMQQRASHGHDNATASKP
jgi:hypothetical protein